jgi:hypothetical protein
MKDKTTGRRKARTAQERPAVTARKRVRLPFEPIIETEDYLEATEKGLLLRLADVRSRLEEIRRTSRAEEGAPGSNNGGAGPYDTARVP